MSDALPTPRPGERLDRFLARSFPGLARSEIRGLLSRGSVKLGGRPLRKGHKFAPGECPELDPGAVAGAGEPFAAPDPGAPLEVVWEDDEVYALSKPAGMPTQPLRRGERDTLLGALLARHPELGAVGGDPRCPSLLHRLDIWTSGVVLAAKTREAWESLWAQFRARTVEKRYWGWVAGGVGAGQCDLPLAHAARSPCRMRVAGERDGERLSAESSWRPLWSDGTRTLLEVTIFSGVTHQIRCHLAHAGHPLLGDVLYGGPAIPLGRHLLHARSVRWRAADGSVRVAAAPPPADFPLPPASVGDVPVP